MKTSVRGFFVASVLTLLSGGVHAGTVLIGDGIEWSWSSASIGQSSGSLTLSANVDGSLLGDVRLAAFQLKSDAAPAVASGSVVGGGWTLVAGELNANGCTGGSGDNFKLCFEANAIGSSVSDASDFDLVVNFALNSGVLPDTLHLKVLWNEFNPNRNCTSGGGGPRVCEGGWDKVGSLISADFTSTSRDVPAPGILALLGLGLAGVGLVRRRHARHAARGAV